jgi:hypothetical protein
MKIPGIVYILVGGFVLWFSNYTAATSDVKIAQFQLFIWLGYAFMILGALKVIWGLITKPRKKKVPHKVYHGSHHPSAAAKFCNKCGSEIHQFAHFCHNCGERIFHKK